MNTHTTMHTTSDARGRLIFSLVVILFTTHAALAQTAPVAQAAPEVAASAQQREHDGIALAPARFELEMQPGAETTVVVNLDYHTSKPGAQASRILATLNDWTLNTKGELEFYKAGTRPDTASPWIIYSPGEVLVEPGKTHSIRVTITVPKDAAPGDHLSALVIEQRPDTIKLNRNVRQMLLRYRMAAMFYIKVSNVTRLGSLENLKASAGEDGIIITPTLKNTGNSVIRPVTALTITDASGRAVAELPEAESLPVLANSELSQPVHIRKLLPPGVYTVKFKVDFQGHGKATEGITELVIKEKETPPVTPATTASGINSN